MSKSKSSSSSSRRKTLSHSEIESFLTELATVKPGSITHSVVLDNMMETANALDKDKDKDSYLNVSSLLSEEQCVRYFCKVR